MNLPGGPDIFAGSFKSQLIDYFRGHIVSWEAFGRFMLIRTKWRFRTSWRHFGCTLWRSQLLFFLLFMQLGTLEQFHNAESHENELTMYTVGTRWQMKKMCVLWYPLSRRPFNPSNRVFHDRPVWRISVRLSDRSQVTQHKINFVKNCPEWGLNPWPPDHQSPALPTELARHLLETISHVELCLFLESIEHDFIKALMIHTHNQIVT